MAPEYLAKIRVLLNTEQQASHLAELANALRPAGSPWSAVADAHALEMYYSDDATPETVARVSRLCADFEQRVRPEWGLYGSAYVTRKYAPATDTLEPAEPSGVPERCYALGEHTIRVDRWHQHDQWRNITDWERMEYAASRDEPITTREQLIYATVLRAVTAPYGLCKPIMRVRGPLNDPDSFDVFVVLTIAGDPLSETDVAYAAYVDRQLNPPPKPTYWQRAVAWLRGCWR